MVSIDSPGKMQAALLICVAGYMRIQHVEEKLRIEQKPKAQQ